jgi:hypothetical protein
MSDIADLTVRVLDDRDIVVAGAEFEVTYRREAHLGMLVATDALRERLTASKGALPGGGLESCIQEGKDARLALVLTRQHSGRSAELAEPVAPDQSSTSPCSCAAAADCG